jgi:hypothetical protein
VPRLPYLFLIHLTTVDMWMAPSIVNFDSRQSARSPRAGAFFQNHYYRTLVCKRPIKMSPLCKVEVTLPGVLGFREVRRGGGVDEQAGALRHYPILALPRPTRAAAPVARGEAD